MGFNKQIRSKKDVTVNYWRLKSFSFNESGILRMFVAGYKNSKSYAAGAEPVDEYECIVSNADLSLKAPFYDLLEGLFPFFEGAVKDLSHSRQTSGAQALTVQTLHGGLVMQNFIGGDAPSLPVPEPEEAFLEEGLPVEGDGVLADLEGSDSPKEGYF